MKTFVKNLSIVFFLLFSTNGFAQKSLTDFIDGMKNSSNPEQFVPQIKKEKSSNNFQLRKSFIIKTKIVRMTKKPSMEDAYMMSFFFPMAE